MQSITSVEGFKSAITSAHRVVVDCYTEWCGPCKRIAPDIAALAKQEKGNVLFFKCNGDSGDEALDSLLEQYGADSFPTFLYFHQGCFLRELTVKGSNLAAVRSSLNTLKNM